MYKVVYLDAVYEDLKRLDKPFIRKILNKIEKHLARDPFGLGKPLTGTYKGMWRYRYGDFRIIYRIAQKEILIEVARIGHRKNIYK